MFDAANAREREAQGLIADESAKIDALAEYKVSSTKNDLKKKYDELVKNQNNSHEHKMRELERLYKGKVKLLYGLTRGGIVYGLFVTSLAAVNSKRFSNDFILVFKFLGNYICFLLENAFDLASAAWSLKEHIPLSHHRCASSWITCWFRFSSHIPWNHSHNGFRPIYHRKSLFKIICGHPECCCSPGISCLVGMVC